MIIRKLPVMPGTGLFPAIAGATGSPKGVLSDLLREYIRNGGAAIETVLCDGNG